MRRRKRTRYRLNRKGDLFGAFVPPTENPEIDTPGGLTAFFSIGQRALNNSVDADSNSLWLSTAPAKVRLCVINSKSANFDLRVTVRPRAPIVPKSSSAVAP
jgi:hypothetical protein